MDSIDGVNRNDASQLFNRLGDTEFTSLHVESFSTRSDEQCDGERDKASDEKGSDPQRSSAIQIGCSNETD